MYLQVLNCFTKRSLIHAYVYIFCTLVTYASYVLNKSYLVFNMNILIEITDLFKNKFIVPIMKGTHKCNRKFKNSKDYSGINNSPKIQCLGEIDVNVLVHLVRVLFYANIMSLLTLCVKFSTFSTHRFNIH